MILVLTNLFPEKVAALWYIPQTKEQPKEVSLD